MGESYGFWYSGQNNPKKLVMCVNLWKLSSSPGLKQCWRQDFFSHCVHKPTVQQLLQSREIRWLEEWPDQKNALKLFFPRLLSEIAAWRFFPLPPHQVQFAAIMYPGKVIMIPHPSIFLVSMILDWKLLLYKGITDTVKRLWYCVLLVHPVHSSPFLYQTVLDKDTKFILPALCW